MTKNCSSSYWRPHFEKSDMCPKFETSIKPVINIGGTSDYNDLSNRPSINGVELIGNKTNEQILIQPLTNEDIENLFKQL